MMMGLFSFLSSIGKKLVFARSFISGLGTIASITTLYAINGLVWCYSFVEATVIIGFDLAPN